MKLKGKTKISIAGVPEWWWTLDIFAYRINPETQKPQLGFLTPKHVYNRDCFTQYKEIFTTSSLDNDPIALYCDVMQSEDADVAVAWISSNEDARAAWFKGSRNIKVKIAYNNTLNWLKYGNPIIQDGLGSALTHGVFNNTKGHEFFVKPTIDGKQELSLGGDCGAAWWYIDTVENAWGVAVAEENQAEPFKSYIVGMHTTGNNETLFPDVEFAAGVDINYIKKWLQKTSNGHIVTLDNEDPICQGFILNKQPIENDFILDKRLNHTGMKHKTASLGYPFNPDLYEMETPVCLKCSLNKQPTIKKAELNTKTNKETDSMKEMEITEYRIRKEKDDVIDITISGKNLDLDVLMAKCSKAVNEWGGGA